MALQWQKFPTTKKNSMPITNEELWNDQVKNNTDPYGKAVVDTAREVMRLLDENTNDFNCHQIVCDADKNIKAGGITGFMAGCVAQIVSQLHSRGEEFHRKWNLDNQIGSEGEKANEKGGVLNPALLNVD